jgi:hypothetical protein
MNDEKTTWRKLILLEMARQQEKWGDIVSSTFEGTTGLDDVFDSGFGGHEGCAFTLWTKERVYFLIVYDGAEWAGSAPRNPCDQATPHLGGE